MTDHLNTFKLHATILTPAMIANGFHLCPEGDGRIVGPGTEGWEECQCGEKRKTKNANHSHQN